MSASSTRSKLGILIPEFPTQTHAFFWREIEAIRAQGVEVEIFSTKRPPEGSCKHAFASGASKETHYLYPPKLGSWLPKILTHPLGTIHAFAYVLGLKESRLSEKLKALGFLICGAALADLSKSFHVGHIHVHSCGNAAHIAALARVVGGPSYSLHLHGDLPVYGKDHRSKMRDASFVSADARPMQQQSFEIVGIDENKTYTIPMGIVVSDSDGWFVHDVSNGTFKLITVARLNGAKGHRYALEACRRLLDDGIDFRYTIVGSGPHLESIQNVIAELNLSEYVCLTGNKSEQEVIGLLHNSDAFVLPSCGLGEASPVALMEAMHAGLPVVCSIIGGTPDMITDGVDGFLVEQKNVDQLVERLTQLATSPDLRRSLGIAARERARSQFDVRITANRLLTAIETHSAWRRNS